MVNAVVIMTASDAPRDHYVQGEKHAAMHYFQETIVPC